MALYWNLGSPFSLRFPATALVQTSVISCLVSLLLSASKYLFDASIQREHLLNLLMTPHNLPSWVQASTQGRPALLYSSSVPSRLLPVTAAISTYSSPIEPLLMLFHLLGEPSPSFLPSRRPHPFLEAHTTCPLQGLSIFSLPVLNVLCKLDACKCLLS